MEVKAPEDPFLPSGPPPPPAVEVVVTETRGAQAGRWSGPEGWSDERLPAAPEEPAEKGAPAETLEAAVAPKASEIVLTGVIQGDPPLAVVRFRGQSLFLKIGEGIADTWRLAEINERSVVFRLGAQRVEIPIQGGSAE